jgi:hypothetical protein
MNITRTEIISPRKSRKHSFNIGLIGDFGTQTISEFIKEFRAKNPNTTGFLFAENDRICPKCLFTLVKQEHIHQLFIGENVEIVGNNFSSVDEVLSQIARICKTEIYRVRLTS